MQKIMTRSKRALLEARNRERKDKLKKLTMATKKKILEKKQLSKIKKKSKTKWQMGIIVKPRPKATSRGGHSRAKPRRARDQRPVMTRSVARRLSAENLLTLDKECLVMRHELSTSRILNDDVLKLVFDYLSLKDRFRIQRTCKQFYSVVQQMLGEQVTLRIGNVADWYGHCQRPRHSTANADIEDAICRKFFDKYFYVNDLTLSKEALATILWKCSRVRCLELHNFHVDVDTVRWLSWHAPHLECIRLDAIKYDLTARKWSQIGQCLGDRLQHLSVDGRSIRNDLTNLVQHLPLLTEFRLSKYDLPLTLLLKRLSSNVTVLSLLECDKLTVDAVQALTANRQMARSLRRLELQVSGQCTETDTKEIFALICEHFPALHGLTLLSHLCPPNLQEVTSLEQLNQLELRFSRDCFLDLSPLGSCRPLASLRSLTVHGAFFMPRMLANIGHWMPGLVRLCLTNWAFVCQCPDNQSPQMLDDCPECDDRCCQSLLELTRLRQLYLEFLYSSDYIKPLILSLLTFEQLNKVSLVWYPVNTSINTMNFVADVVANGCRVASSRSRELIRLGFEKNVIALIDASKKLPKNLVVEAID